MLFTIFINDLPENLNVHCKVFADDTKIYEDVKKSNQIQKDLYSMQKWTEHWNLYFNVSKCKVMHIGKKNPKIEYYMKLEDNLQKLETCEEEKDLGITFDPNYLGSKTQKDPWKLKSFILSRKSVTLCFFNTS